ncbi:MAG: methionine--tRNA ligase [Holosporaceae bacterium]|jgi:methionyl-tRNA synthetase|nr:methionine--tRNA ligase [Holosporaceae bacterium]
MSNFRVNENTDPAALVVTTPIYYINGEPHIGHAYASIAADIIVRFKRLDGCEVHFSTGTDEHGIKVARSAQAANADSYEFCNIMSGTFQNMNKAINLSEHDFIRTTEERHKKSATAFWKLLEKDIYKNTYAGWYSVRDEEYVPESEIVDGKAPSGAPVEWVEEDSYFFRLSSYQERLLRYYEENPDFIAPPARKNEVVSFVRNGLKDLSISRSKFTWGIPVPDAAPHVMYVWVDALTNYITSLGFPENKDNVSAMMRNCIHIVGKEILRFHAVYWPAFLMSAGISLPKRIFAHGWWTHDGQKMSKSLGNVVNPFDTIKNYGLDQLRYFLFREVHFGEDGDFSEKALQDRTSYDLANDIGNLVQRVLAFIQKLGGFLTINYDFTPSEKILFDNARELVGKMRTKIDKQDLHGALDTVWSLIAESNKFVNDMKPWVLVNTDTLRLNAILTVLCESIKAIAFGISPFMPDTASKIFGFINTRGEAFIELENNFTDQKFPVPIPLFPKEK